MGFDIRTLRILARTISRIFGFIPLLLVPALASYPHRLTYKATPDPKNVVVLGGSFTGIQTARRLCHSLPTGYRVILIEKNSHFHFLFKFPRFSVFSGNEHKAFIPYTGFEASVPEGILEIVHDTVSGVTENEVHLASGKVIPYAYLAIATGSTALPPAKLVAEDKSGACGELRFMQDKIKAAQRIAVVGGGAVGVELATDAKSEYAEKDIMLIHSRERLMNGFGNMLSERVLKEMNDLGVEVKLGERPALPAGGEEGTSILKFKDGSIKEFDLVIPCTGQKPNSDVLFELAPESISSASNSILVAPTLQVCSDFHLQKDAQSGIQLEIKRPNIFALGDVAETGGVKMARAGFIQAEIAAANMLKLIKGSSSLVHYEPSPLEGSIALTLGKDHTLVCQTEPGLGEIVWKVKSRSDDADIGKMWKMLQMNMKKDCEN